MSTVYFKYLQFTAILLQLTR